MEMRADHLTLPPVTIAEIRSLKMKARNAKVRHRHLLDINNCNVALQRDSPFPSLSELLP